MANYYSQRSSVSERTHDNHGISNASFTNDAPQHRAGDEYINLGRIASVSSRSYEMYDGNSAPRTINNLEFPSERTGTKFDDNASSSFRRFESAEGVFNPTLVNDLMYINKEHKEDSEKGLNGNGKEIVVVVGTGDLGRAMTICLVRAGYRVIVASRNPDKHRSRYSLIGAEIDTFSVAVYRSSIILLAIPFDAFALLPIHSLNEKIVVDVSNRPVGYNSKEGSLADYLQKLLPQSKVVKAFNTLSAYALQKGLVQGSKEIPICSDYEDAKEKIITLARNLGFTPVDFGTLENARAVEDIPLAFFTEWKGPAISALCVWIFAFLFMLFRMQLCPNFVLLINNDEWNWRLFSSLPLTTVFHSLGLTAITMLTACYFPGVIAAYIQLNRQTKYSEFPQWLDTWLKARKYVGLLAYCFAVPHFLLAFISSIAFGITFTWRESLYYFCGVSALSTMTVLAVTSLPSVVQHLTWREFTFIHSYLGWICLFFATFHVIFMKWKILISDVLECYFMPDAAQVFLLFPLLTILMKLPLLIPWVNAELQRIRRGQERGMTQTI